MKKTTAKENKMTETTTTLSLDVNPHIAAGCDERFSASEVAEAGGLDELVVAYRDHHADRIADIHGITDLEVFSSDAGRYILVSYND